MALWLKVRRPWFLAATLVLLAPGLIVLGGRGAAVPTVLGGGNGPLVGATLLPLLYAAAVCYCLESRADPIEARATQAVRWLDVGGFVGSTLVAVVLFMALRPPELPALRAAVDVLVLAGLAGCAVVRLGAAPGVLTVTAFLLLTTTYSPYVAGAAYVRVVQPDGDLAWSATVGALLTLAAITLLGSTVGTRR